MTFELPGATGRHEHGTRSRYVKGCRCDECRAANLAVYREREARSKAAAAAIPRTADGRCPGIEGDPCPTSTRLRSDSAPVCHRCRKRLVWNGLVDAKRPPGSISASSPVADASDTGRTTLAKILSGEKKRIRKSTADAIFAVDHMAVSDHGLVDAGPTWQRLRELQPNYFTNAALAGALGYRSPALQIGKTQVLAKTELPIRRFHEKMLGNSTP